MRFCLYDSFGLSIDTITVAFSDLKTQKGLPVHVDYMRLASIVISR